MITERFKNAWNAFLGRDPTPSISYGGSSGSFSPSRNRLFPGSYRTIKGMIYNRIAVDCSSIDIRHVRLDEEGNYKETIKDGLNRALTLEANMDQTGRDLIRDAVISMMDEGVVAIVPVVTDVDPSTTNSYNIYELRIAKILEWFPSHVRIEIYDSVHGVRVQRDVEKRYTAIIENPFYNIMNEPNSTMQRLNRVLAKLDEVNAEMSPNKLNMIIQVPYPIKTPEKQKLAEKRVKDIEDQLTYNKFGIAYADATEKIVQLNRSLENNLWEQAEKLQSDLFNQLGLSQGVFDGTADEKTMLNYINQTIEPILSTLVENMERKWITPTAMSQGQAIRFFREPFKLVPVANLAEIADKFTRNEIMTSNEIRSFIGVKPSVDPKADKLINSNLNHPEEKQVDETITVQR